MSSQSGYHMVKTKVLQRNKQKQRGPDTSTGQGVGFSILEPFAACGLSGSVCLQSKKCFPRKNSSYQGDNDTVKDETGVAGWGHLGESQGPHCRGRQGSKSLSEDQG